MAAQALQDALNATISSGGDHFALRPRAQYVFGSRPLVVANGVNLTIDGGGEVSFNNLG